MIFASPPEQSLEWSDSGLEGCYKFLKRLWALGFKVSNLTDADFTSNGKNLIEANIKLFNKLMTTTTSGLILILLYRHAWSS